MLCFKNSGNFQKFPGSLILEISGNFLDVKMKQNARNFWNIPDSWNNISQGLYSPWLTSAPAATLPWLCLRAAADYWLTQMCLCGCDCALHKVVIIFMYFVTVLCVFIKSLVLIPDSLLFLPGESRQRQLCIRGTLYRLTTQIFYGIVERHELEKEWRAFL